MCPIMNCHNPLTKVQEFKIWIYTKFLTSRIFIITIKTNRRCPYSSRWLTVDIFITDHLQQSRKVKQIGIWWINKVSIWKLENYHPNKYNHRRNWKFKIWTPNTGRILLYQILQEATSAYVDESVSHHII